MLNVGIGCYQLQAQKCAVCEMLVGITTGLEERATVEFAFYGGKKYALCPCCGRVVPPKWSMDYIRRFEKWIADRREEK